MSPAGTRDVLHRIAAHVLGRRRFEVAGRFGLRASPGGFATPAFGAGPEVVRVSGGLLIREVGAAASAVPIAGSTLRQLTALAGTEMAAGFSAGAGTPDPGDVDARLDLDEKEAARLADWWSLGWVVLDRAVSELAGVSDPETVQLWPEHFDAATTVTTAAGARVNLGFSPGDSWSDEPYLYLGPWENSRPGDPLYWNAPFGAVIREGEVLSAADPIAECLSFLDTGIRYLSDGASSPCN